MSDPIQQTFAQSQAQAYSAADAADTASRVPQETLGQEDFLEILTVQMTNQDPLEPMSDTEFIAQMAEFTALEQTNALIGKFDEFSATSFLGKEVDISFRDTLTGTQINDTGIVDEVMRSGSDTFLRVNGTLYNYQDLVAVRQTAAPNQQPPAQG